MATTQRSETATRAHAIYDEKIRAQVEATHHGDFVAIDVDSGDWEVDKVLLKANKRLRERRPQTRTFFMRVGHLAAVSLGGFSTEVKGSI